MSLFDKFKSKKSKVESVPDMRSSVKKTDGTGLHEADGFTWVWSGTGSIFDNFEDDPNCVSVFVGVCKSEDLFEQYWEESMCIRVQCSLGKDRNEIITCSACRKSLSFRSVSVRHQQKD